MIIYVGAIRACVDFFKWMFKERKPEEIAKGGDGAFRLTGEQEEHDIARLKDGGWKCYSCGYVNRKLTINCEKCTMGKYESEDKYKEDAIRRLKAAQGKEH